MRRRDWLRWGLAGALGVAAPGATALLASSRAGGRRPDRAAPTTAPPPSPPPGAFTVPLPIPEVLTPVSTSGDVDRYEIWQRVGRQQIRPDVETEVWGYEGSFPGPTIEVRAGRRVEVTHHNELPVPTVVHLHGAVAEAEHDGYPTDFVLPDGGDWANDPAIRAHAAHAVAGTASGSRTYVYPNQQPAAMLWYHDHRMDFAGPQQYRGLAGIYVIRDEIEDRLPLPRGERELPLMIADRRFDADGALFYPSLDPELREPGVSMDYHWSGMLGDTIVVNGVAWPYCEVDAALYRLRLVNASNARRYQLALDPPPPDGDGFIQIGSDLGLLDRPVRYETFLLSPGERYDLLIDFAAYQPGTSVLLRNTAEPGPAGYVMRFDVTRRATDDARVPDVLSTELRPPPAERPADRSFAFFSGPDGTGLPGMINNQVFAPDRIDAQVPLGSTEIWDLTADPDHPVHLHLAHFRVLSRDGFPPEPQDAGVKDTVFVPEGGVRVAVTFTGYRGKYVFHCHNLEHSDAGMMANLEVV
ncbi:MAG TPA: multicopper oxidase family protein [Natronosporangium sp.]